MANQVTLHINGGRATFGAVGIQLTPWFARHRLEIPWANVTFVSPVPAVQRIEDEWHTFRGEHITPAALRKTLRFYCLAIALNERADLLASTSLFTRMWLLMWLVGSVRFKPLGGAEADPSKGSITLYFRKRWLRRNGSGLLSALDIVERFSKFGLLVTSD